MSTSKHWRCCHAPFSQTRSEPCTWGSDCCLGWKKTLLVHHIWWLPFQDQVNGNFLYPLARKSVLKLLFSVFHLLINFQPYEWGHCLLHLFFFGQLKSHFCLGMGSGIFFFLNVLTAQLFAALLCSSGQGMKPSLVVQTNLYICTVFSDKNLNVRPASQLFVPVYQAPGSSLCLSLIVLNKTKQKGMLLLRKIPSFYRTLKVSAKSLGFSPLMEPTSYAFPVFWTQNEKRAHWR